MAGTRKTIAPEERPERTPDRNLETAVQGTFPASDPLSTIASQGARAVPAEDILTDSSDRAPDDLVTLTRRFADHEAAKLTLETLVRDGPLDRRCAEIHDGTDATMLEVRVARAEAARIEALLRKAGGQKG